MLYCPECGTYVEEDVRFCPNCGANIEITKQEIVSEPPEEQELTTLKQPSYEPELPPLERRNFWIWFLLSIVTSGIGALIYSYINFEDMNKLNKYPKPARVPSIETDTSTYLILSVVGLFLGFFPIINLIYTYRKFNLLYKYITNHPQSQKNMPPKPSKFIWAMVLSIVLPFLFSIPIIVLSVIQGYSGSSQQIAFIIPIVFGSLMAVIGIGLLIYFIILQVRWQDAYNERVLMIDPNAPENLF
ncbi:MAG: zinc-ribbon domain-containing protein [Asgard group archaeon]|nr:zinc-ribbon domain-containing protein [Asgard group archaeon]